MNLTLWLEADSGFYLIIQKRPGEYQVRSHLRECLEKLKRLADLEGEIIDSPQSAMRFRIALNSQQVFLMLARIDGYEHESRLQRDGESMRAETTPAHGLAEPHGYAEGYAEAAVA